MLDRKSGCELNNAIEVHTVEMTKYNLQADTIAQASKLVQWAFLLLRAQDYDSSSLKRLLPGIAFATAKPDRYPYCNYEVPVNRPPLDRQYSLSLVKCRKSFDRSRPFA